MNNLGIVLMIIPLSILVSYAIFKFFQLVFEDEDYKSPEFWIGLVLVIIFCTGLVITVMQYEASK